MMEYDESDQNIEIKGLDEVKIYVAQNESQEVKRRRSVREALRALEVPHLLPLPLRLDIPFNRTNSRANKSSGHQSISW